ncbi:type IV pilus biogenesis/stability protein PilW [Pontibacterium sp.]|uniref:type IV pilus biogenesis/stability protein PilW n=1 Tax=Pontibacterium sp. TaxID=2036026 RepID=UPI0035686FD3
MNGLRLTLILTLILLTGCSSENVRRGGDGADAANAAYNRLGIEYLQAGDLQGAKKSFQKSLALVPSDAEAFNGLALVFQLEGEAALAEEYFRKATDQAPQSAMIRNNFGAFLFAAERYEEACEELAQATQDPFYNRRAQAFENLARCYNNLNNSAAAKHAFERALQISPSRVISMIELASIELDQGRLNQAESYFERFNGLVERRRVEHYAKSLWVGIRIARERGQASQAATYALLLKNLFPDSAEYKLYEESAR